MKRKHGVIAHGDVQDAVQKFIGDGGTILRQPDHVAAACNVVGSSHANYELILQLSPVVVPLWWSQSPSPL